MAGAVRWLTLSLLCALGCGSSDARELHDFRLSLDGGRTFESVTLPARLDRRLPQRDLSFELSTHVSLPAAQRGTLLRLALPATPALVRLYVDGVQAAEESPSLYAAYRRRSPIVWYVPQTATQDGEVHLRFVLAQRFTQSGWFGEAPRLFAESDPISRVGQFFNLFWSLGCFASLLIISLTSLTVYVADRSRRAYLWFAFQGLCGTYFPLYVLGLSQLWLGTWDGPLLGFSLLLGITASVYFAHAFFELGPPSRLWWPATLLFCVAPAVLHDPYTLTPYSAPIVNGFLVLGTLHQLRLGWRLVRTHDDRRSALHQLGVWVVLAAACTPDLVTWMGWGELLHGVRSTNIGLTALALGNALLLARRHLSSLREADALNEQLRARVAQLESRGQEIEALNRELKRQIKDRAEQLYATAFLAAAEPRRAPVLRGGQVLNERYRVERPIGAGGMGTVYEVTRLDDQRRLALKLAREVSGETLARLLREAHVAATVNHPHVVSIADVDVVAGAFPYLVLELVHGSNLRAQEARWGELHWALCVLRQVADGLCALHEAGVVHRDLKPENVLLEGEGDAPCVKITDFGIALAQTRRPVVTPVHGRPAHEQTTADHPASAARLTRTGLVAGTPAYMAPELRDGLAQASSAADLFAFGVIAFEVLTGGRPVGESPRLLRTLPAAPPVLAALVDRCLAREPALRPSARELLALLESLPHELAASRGAERYENTDEALLAAVRLDVPSAFSPQLSPVLLEQHSQLRDVALVARGGMGVVYRAHHVALGRQVAVKLVKPGPSQRALARRLSREARALQKLAHPGIVELLHVEERADQLLLVMAFVEGTSLRALLRKGPSTRHLDAMARVGDALGAAHEAGIVHRDVKPENILVRRDGTPCLIDFGLSMGAEPSAHASVLTSPLAVIGTAAYMAPEQARGEPCDARADQYAWAVTCWELCTGSRPSRASGGAPRPEGWAAVLSRAMSEEPSQRFPGMREAVRALRAATVTAA
jgi:serine/threonine protein kinase